MMCRNLWTLWALSVAFGCMVGLAVANRILMATEGQQERARRRVEDDALDSAIDEVNASIAEWNQREDASSALRDEAAWLIFDSVCGQGRNSTPIVFERDGGAFMAERN